MKNSSVIVLGSALAVFVMAACESNSNSNSKGANRFGYRGSSSSTQYATPTPTPEGLTDQPPAPIVQPTPEATPTPTPPPAAPRDVAYGTPVPGKPGFVTSPHSPYAGYVDVRGFPPNTEVKCPYSGKIFLVP
ncbi:MAG: hypothetical protein NTZ94_09635 [Verrucomicrobia bacterium]|nr:hypothetical protein [Verrucomicrobiota bacterium]